MAVITDTNLKITKEGFNAIVIVRYKVQFNNWEIKLKVPYKETIKVYGFDWPRRNDFFFFFSENTIEATSDESEYTREKIIPKKTLDEDRDAYSAGPGVWHFNIPYQDEIFARVYLEPRFGIAPSATGAFHRTNTVIKDL